MATIADATIRVSVAGADAATRALRGMTRGALGGAGALGAAGLAGAAAAVGIGVAKGVKSFIDFDKALRNVQSTSKQSDASLHRMGQRLQSTAVQFGQSQVAMAEALYLVNGAGVQGAAGLDLVTQAAKAAVAGASDVQTASSVMVGVMNAYGDAAGSAREVSDTLFKAVDKGQISFSEMAAGMGPTVGLASAVGVSLEEVAAAAAFMTANSIPAAQAFTGVKAAISALTKPNKDLSTALEQIGFTSGTALIKQKGLGGAMVALQQNALKQTGSVDKATDALTGQLGAQEAALFAFQAGGKNAKEYASTLKEVENASKGAGATQAAFAEQSKGAAFQMEQAKSAVDVALTGIGEQIAPMLVKAGNAISTFVKENPAKVRQFAVDFVVAMAKAVEGAAMFGAAVLDATSSAIGGLGMFYNVLGDAADAVGLDDLAAQWREAGAIFDSAESTVNGFRDKLVEASAGAQDFATSVREGARAAAEEDRAFQLLGETFIKHNGGIKGLRREAEQHGVTLGELTSELFRNMEAENRTSGARQKAAVVARDAAKAAREAGAGQEQATAAGREAVALWNEGAPKAKAIAAAIKDIGKGGKDAADGVDQMTPAMRRATAGQRAFGDVFKEVHDAARKAGASEEIASDAALKAASAFQRGVAPAKAVAAGVREAAEAHKGGEKAARAAEQAMKGMSRVETTLTDVSRGAAGAVLAAGGSIDQARTAARLAGEAFQAGTGPAQAIADGIRSAGVSAETAAGKVASLRSNIESLRDRTITITTRSVSVGGGTNSGDSRSASKPHRRGGGGLAGDLPGYIEGAEADVTAHETRVERLERALADARSRLADAPQKIADAVKRVKSTQAALANGKATTLEKQRAKDAKAALRDAQQQRTKDRASVPAWQRQLTPARAGLTEAQRRLGTLTGRSDRLDLGVDIAQARGGTGRAELARKSADLLKQEKAVADQDSNARKRITAERERVNAEIRQIDKEASDTKAQADRDAADAVTQAADAARAEAEAARELAAVNHQLAVTMSDEQTGHLAYLDALAGLTDSLDDDIAAAQAAAAAYWALITKAQAHGASEAELVPLLTAYGTAVKTTTQNMIDQADAAATDESLDVWAALAEATPAIFDATGKYVSGLDDDAQALGNIAKWWDTEVPRIQSQVAQGLKPPAALSAAIRGQTAAHKAVDDVMGQMAQTGTAAVGAIGDVADATGAAARALEADLAAEKARRIRAETSLAGHSAVGQFGDDLRAGRFGGAGFGSLTVNSIWPASPAQIAAMQRAVLGG